MLSANTQNPFASPFPLLFSPLPSSECRSHFVYSPHPPLLSTTFFQCSNGPHTSLSRTHSLCPLMSSLNLIRCILGCALFSFGWSVSNIDCRSVCFYVLSIKVVLETYFSKRLPIFSLKKICIGRAMNPHRTIQ